MIDLLFIILSIIWLSEFTVFRNRKVNDSTDRRSFSWVLIAVLIIITASLISREMNFWVIDWPIAAWFGIIIFASGITLRYWGIRTLGKQFTRHVYVDQADVLIKHGPFKWLRHPLYTGLLLIMTGFTLINLSFIGFLLVFSWFIPTIIHRIQLEESILIESFGHSYEQWMKQRARLIPFIY
ncbi:methyltransferase family protein [Alkalibacillus almallahensis]|uniref:methyltransferase family protein n=1 Tax=Alkalibacillus almallahensis TaxID=1379154 RepID=UPI001421A167|nr:isoprenylcysteine carboxylmethyltransferase family protein [Alkalibacillus almallahensis]NIK12038.1 protein-S-isoprenylcysteine O-methyltransferase Ste14 [Alkalibacillus almallahensis]